MKIAEIKDLSIDELGQKEKDLRKELFNLRFQRSIGEIQDPMRIRATRKDIARVLTVASAKARAGRS